MGIEVKSVLAKVHSEFMAASGVDFPSDELQDNDLDPQRKPEEYVEAIVNRWSKHKGTRSPTWAELLDVLQNVGLIKLSQQIETYLRGKSI